MITPKSACLFLFTSSMLSITGLALSGCDQQNTTPTDETSTETSSEKGNNDAEAHGVINISKQVQSFPIKIDWKKINHEIQPIERDSFNYSFALDSKPVTNYAKMYEVDNQTAQHNLTIGLASNEPLSKILDQLGDEYLGHKLTVGNNMTLVVTTTENIIPSQYNYVIEGEFAYGLVLPVLISHAIE